MWNSFSIVNLIICIVLMGTLYSCDSADDWEHIGTRQISNHKVFVEMFVKRGGVYAGNVENYFVTDSSTYRFSVGICDDKQYFTMKVDGSELIVEKHTRRNLKNGETKIIGTKTYDLE